jgi:hypothetical protein
MGDDFEDPRGARLRKRKVWTMFDEIKEGNAKRLALMQFTSENFYREAQQCEKHQFLEFNGLLIEYIKLLREMHNAQQDFITNEVLPMKPHNAEYIAEKLSCIYGDTFLAQENVRNAFIEALFKGEFRLVPADAAVEVMSHDELVNEMCRR